MKWENKIKKKIIKLFIIEFHSDKEIEWSSHKIFGKDESMEKVHIIFAMHEIIIEIWIYWIICLI